jgi:ribonuclease-3
MKLARQDENYKSALLEYAQARGLGAPRYVTQRLSGPDHERVFTIAAVVDNKTIGVGTGRNKKEAEQAAAAEAIKTLRNNSSAERKEDSDGV